MPVDPGTPGQYDHFIGTSTSWPSEPTVVGRQTELSALDALCERAGTRFAALCVQGEPGIGKTTVWREGVRRAREVGMRALVTRATELEAGLTFTGLMDLLAPVDDGHLSRLPAPQREALTAALLRAAPGKPGIDERSLFAGVVSLLRVLSEDGPLLVAVDDAQWLDHGSARALEFAMRRLEAERVGVLSAVRTGGPPNCTFDVAAGPNRQVLTVGPLTADALHEVVVQRTGLRLARPLLVQVAKLCGGNPFYALEVATELARHPASEVRLVVPPALGQLVAGRLERLPEHTREALLVAAALAKPTTRLVDLEALEPAEQEGIVLVSGGRVEFAHPLFASAVYKQAGAAARRRAHRRLAAVVPEPEERARHLALGSDRPDSSIADQLDRAATLVAGRGAPEAAGELVELAIGFTPEQACHERGTRMLALARFCLASGDFDRAQDLLDAPELSGQAEPGLRARALHLLCQLHWRRHSFTDAVAAATQALELAAGDETLLAEIELDLAYCYTNVGDITGAVTEARSAVQRGALDREALASALATLAITELICGGGFPYQLMEEAPRLEDLLRPGPFVFRPRYISGILSLWTGRLEEALATLDHLSEETCERGEEGATPLISHFQVWAHLWQGEVTAAARVCDKARAAATLLGDPAAEAMTLAFAGLVHAHEGQLGLARQEAGEALSIFRRLQWPSGTIWALWALGLAELSDGNPVAVKAALGPPAEMVTELGACDPCLGVFLPDLVEALVELGDLDQAERYARWMEERGAQLDRPWAAAMGARCRALVLGGRGDTGGATAALERSLSLLGDEAMPVERARTLLVLGRTLRRSHRRRRAQLALEEARGAFQRAGMPLWARRADAELERTGQRVSGPDELSRTERAVATLAAAGLSNREIAERAFISTKAVEANLTRVFRKLRIRSRAGLARALDAEGESQRA